MSDPGAGGRRTGARRPGGPPRQHTATYRGIRWRKDPDGTIGWYNDGAGGWVRWRPGGDAPPLPPRWEADAARVPVPPRVRRAPWRSPYRIVPIVLVLAAVGIGVLQATRTGNGAAATANREAHALVGRCLARTGGTAAAPVYGAKPVSCRSPAARLQVLDVVAADHACPRGTTAVQLSYVGVSSPDLECTRPVGAGG